MGIKDIRILSGMVLIEPIKEEAGRIIGGKKIIFASTEASYLLRDLHSNIGKIVKLADDNNITEIALQDKVYFHRFNGQSIVLKDTQGNDREFLIVPAQDIICKIGAN